MEMRRWKSCLQHLEAVKGRLVDESEALALRIDCLSQPDLSVNSRHNPIITCKDVAFSRYASFADPSFPVYSCYFLFFFTTNQSCTVCKIFPFRLLQILERASDKGRAEPFRTYESLEQAAHQVAADLRATRDALAGAAREQHYTVARLKGDCEALHRAMYTDLQQLKLGPQVCPLGTTDQELLCPNAQVGFFLCTPQRISGNSRV